jgi:hypothetical protein
MMVEDTFLCVRSWEVPKSKIDVNPASVLLKGGWDGGDAGDAGQRADERALLAPGGHR